MSRIVISYDGQDLNSLDPINKKVVFELDTNMTRRELLNEFACFLNAIGYSFSPDEFVEISKLQFAEEDSANRVEFNFDNNDFD
jgi:hypothetical protein